MGAEVGRLMIDEEGFMWTVKSRRVRRVDAFYPKREGVDGFEEEDDSDRLNKQGVGWIVDGDIANCMICHAGFCIFRHRHHCRSCGNIVCHSCSPSKVFIFELGVEEGLQRACVQCFYGPETVYASTWTAFHPDSEQKRDDCNRQHSD